MREILGKRRRLLSLLTGLLHRSGSARSGRRPDDRGGIVAGRPAGGGGTADAALGFARWGWPVLPGAAPGPGGRGGCACPDPECRFPGAHPFDPELLAATADARMVRWWWGNRPSAPVLLATGEGAAPCAVSLPAVAAARAVAELEREGVRLGPVVASPTRWALLVRPYSLERLGELLHAQDMVPGSLRFHGQGGYLALPPSVTGQGRVRWVREPESGDTAPWLPEVERVVVAAVTALTRPGVAAPDA
ncbi:bifunctional DNA primase/polymerase [Streptomyces sp. NPDC005012]|uniref:bifunctional DNA primase/polymerase n=1 Tax=unclassified Streptomyces TaxID=2593676 RepID=UPI0033AEF9E6